ncbi:MAG: hypothetical protein Q8N99_08340 [Nanoarchaeota archaeon]|nr:hypothetical protein [Nanoarchaeota archaeon]
MGVNYTIGLLIITLAWLLQLFFSLKERKIRKRFLVLYSLGTTLLIIDSWSLGLIDAWVLNLVILAIVLLMLIIISIEKPKIISVERYKRMKQKRKKR